MDDNRDKDYENFEKLRNYEIVEKLIKDRKISGADVLDAITNYHGMELIDAEFVDYFVEEYGAK